MCEEYDSKLRSCFVLLKTGSSFVPPIAGTSNDAARSLLKSPVAPLPKFASTEGEDLIRFFTEFEETISKFSYSEYDKLLLLKQQISGRALTLVNSLEADKLGYSHAKSLLLEALASKDIQIFNVIKKLSKLSMGIKDDPFSYISNMRMISETIKRLKVETDSFLQYFFWTGMNQSFQKHLVQICNKARPSLQEINSHFFEASERYISSSNLRKSELPVINDHIVSRAADINIHKNEEVEKSVGFKTCSICTKVGGVNASHPLHKCDKFPDASDKLAQIKKFGGCDKCGYLNHSSASCRFKFASRCRNCYQWHFSFLCPGKRLNSNLTTNPSDSSVSGPPNNSTGALSVHNRSIDKYKKPKIDKKKSNTKSKDNENSNTSSNIVVSETSNNSSSILPTFTCWSGDDKIRALKDCGSQSNFITESLARKLNLNVIKPLKFTVNGMNASRQYDSRLVEIELMVKNKIYPIPAFCNPEISIKLNLKILGSIVNHFKSKGFELADEDLSELDDTISNIDLILGTKSSFLLPSTDVPFGRDNMSMYINTPLGVLLQGDVDKLVEDLPSLARNGSQTPSDACIKSFMSSVAYSRCESSRDSFSDVDIAFETNLFISVLDDGGDIIEKNLKLAIDQMLEEGCRLYTRYDNEEYNDENVELNEKLVKYAFHNCRRDVDGRLVFPLLWNSDVAHLLGKNFNLSKSILLSNLRKLKDKPEFLHLMDDVFKEQVELGIIERISDLDEFMTINPSHSFLPHMGVFKLKRETTKCRIVFLSNLCGNIRSQSMTVSHNQAIHSGPDLNGKLSSSILQLRFGLKLLCFDVIKAFNNIVLETVDQNRVLFLWFRNVRRNDFSVVAYRNIRLSFGLRCSPALLMMAMYKILVLDQSDSEDDNHLKNLVYHLSFMDNCAVSSNCSSELLRAYELVQNVFGSYKFGLQQFVTNDVQLQSVIDSETDTDTADEVKLLGMCWNRLDDELYTKPVQLNLDADTKRTILSSSASQFDLFNINGPILIRSRLFMHELQCDKLLGWDEKLSPERIRMWRNICKMANSTSSLKLKRCVGSRDDTYDIVALSDSK